MPRPWRPLVVSLALTFVCPSPVPAAADDVGWPPSSDLVVGEVVTGGASGSDEYVELYNAGTEAVQLAGLELVYVSASGKSVSRKRTWTDRALAAGQRLLLANADGTYATVADQTYSGGFSALGGSLVLRAAGGEVVDSLSWGAAVSAFVEGTSGVAPDPGFSLERRPGGSAGNGRDTNDNAADTLVNPNPQPEGISGAGPAPTPGPTPTPAPTPKSTPTPTPKPTQPPTPTPTTEPTTRPTATPTPVPTPTLPPQEPAPMPSAVPVPAPSAGPTAAPTARPTPTPVATPTPDALPIAQVRSRPVGSEVVVAGTVTVQAGRILGDRTLVLQDVSGGLAVRLPSDRFMDTLARGTIAWVRGELAAPYGNLELRPASSTDIGIIGRGGLPEPALIDTVGLREDNEGLLASLVVTVDDVSRYDSGAVSLTVHDAVGEGRVYAFAPVTLGADVIRAGQRLRATGIVGQRASRSGAVDGYRLWLRGAADLQTLDEPPGATAAPDDGSGAAKPPRVRIADAQPGRVVTIVGTVTSRAGLLESEGRRVTVQDKSGAILVRYPADDPPATVGRRIRATGEVGTWYGSRQLEADSSPTLKGRAKVRASTLTDAPDGEDEWQLVVAQLTIADVQRDGDTWRAEAELRQGQALPIVGLAGAGIEADLLEPGRQARVTGIVKRAHPSAADQRFAIAPRSRQDIKLGPQVEHANDTGDDVRGADDDDGEATADGDRYVDGGVVAVTLEALAGLDERVVRVGGRIEEVSEERLTIDDGTAMGVVRIPPRVTPPTPALQPGEVINVRGTVKRRTGGRREVVIDSAADLRRAAALALVNDQLVEEEPRMALSSAMDGGADPPATSEHLPGSSRSGFLLPLLALASLAGGGSLLASVLGAAWWYRRPLTSRAQERPRPSPGTGASSAG